MGGGILLKIFWFIVVYFIVAYTLNLIVGWRTGCNRPENVYGAGYETSRAKWKSYRKMIWVIAGILAFIIAVLVKFPGT